MNFWLMKSEPDVFSIDDLQMAKGMTSGWDGVRNYQARNFMRDDMRKGDRIFFYHSNAKPPGIAGVAEVFQESHPDPTQFDETSEYFDPRATKEKPIWFMVSVKFVEKFPRLISIQELKDQKKLDGLRLLQRGSRLSILPVSKKHWEFICELAKS